MDFNQELNEGGLLRKAKLADRIAIVSCFLLALFWAVDAFFFWVFFGAAVYFRFLAWHFKNQATPKGQAYRHGGEQEPSYRAADRTKKIRISPLIAFVAGLVIFGTIAWMIFSGSVDESENPIEKTQVEDAEKIIADETNPNDLDVLTNRGNEFYNKGKYDSALFYYNRVLTIDPTHQFAQYDKALVYYAQKDYSRSIPILVHCIHQHPEYGEAYWLLGDNYYDRRNLDSAKICFDRAYEKGIRNGGVLQLMASLYEVDNRPKAIALYKESIQQDSTLLDSYKKLIELDPSRRNEYQGMMTKWTPAK